MFSEQIREILEDKVLVSLTNGSMILQEKGVMKVEVVGIPSGVTAIDIDQLAGERGKSDSLPSVKDGPWKQHCDYLLVCEDENGEAAIFVELKKTLKQREKGMEQLRRSLPLLEYLCSICRIHQNMQPDDSRVDARYILIRDAVSRTRDADSRIDKQPVRPGRTLSTESYKNITVNIFVGPKVGFHLLRSA